MIFVEKVSHPSKQLLQLFGVAGGDVVDVGLDLLHLGVDIAAGELDLAFVATPENNLGFMRE
jgi:hypothetical protein